MKQFELYLSLSKVQLDFICFMAHQPFLVYLTSTSVVFISNKKVDISPVFTRVKKVNIAPVLQQCQKCRHKYSKKVALFVELPSARRCSQYILEPNSQDVLMSALIVSGKPKYNFCIIKKVKDEIKNNNKTRLAVLLVNLANKITWHVVIVNELSSMQICCVVDLILIGCSIIVPQR